MEGYSDSENKRKANKVRQLIRISIDKRNRGEDGEEELAEARKLSKELAEYLKTNYPLSFNINHRVLYKTEWNLLMQYFLNGNTTNKILNQIIKENNIKTHDVLFIYDNNDKSFKRNLAIFFDDEGSYFKFNEMRKIEGPKEWYEFIERMGLLPEEAAKLYNIGRAHV